MFKISSNIGKRGEESAKNYLIQNGYKILEQNFCNPSGRRLGEIDIIAKEMEEIVFIEVKTRQKTTHEILPEQNITRDKLYKLNKVAAYYLNKNKLQDINYRFDAISVIADPQNNSAKLRHLKNIFY